MATASSGCFSTISPILRMLEAATRPSTWPISIISSHEPSSPRGRDRAAGGARRAPGEPGRRRQQRRPGPPPGPAADVAFGGGGAVLEHAHQQRADDEQDEEHGDDGDDQHLAHLDDVGASRSPGGWRAAAGSGLVDAGEVHVDELDAVAALFVVADGRAHQRGELLHLLGRARLIGARAVGGDGIGAVDQHRDRELPHLAGVAHLAARRLADLVVGRFLVARGLASAAIGAGRGLARWAGWLHRDGLVAAVAAVAGFGHRLRRAREPGRRDRRSWNWW